MRFAHEGVHHHRVGAQPEARLGAGVQRVEEGPADELVVLEARDLKSQVWRSSGMALISATAAGALAGERKKRAVFEAFQSVAFTSAPLTPSTGWSV